MSFNEIKNPPLFSLAIATLTAIAIKAVHKNASVSIRDAAREADFYCGVILEICLPKSERSIFSSLFVSEEQAGCYRGSIEDFAKFEAEKLLFGLKVTADKTIRPANPKTPGWTG